jgi:hypothetical protein
MTVMDGVADARPTDFDIKRNFICAKWQRTYREVGDLMAWLGNLVLPRRFPAGLAVKRHIRWLSAARFVWHGFSRGVFRNGVSREIILLSIRRGATHSLGTCCMQLAYFAQKKPATQRSLSSIISNYAV